MLNIVHQAYNIRHLEMNTKFMFLVSLVAVSTDQARLAQINAIRAQYVPIMCPKTCDMCQSKKKWQLRKTRMARMCAFILQMKDCCKIANGLNLTNF